MTPDTQRPDLEADDDGPVLNSLLTAALATTLSPADGTMAPAVRERLQARLAASRAAEAAMVTTRLRRVPPQALGDGVTARVLYLGTPGGAARPGEPLRARLIDLAPGANLDARALGPADELRGRHREWLVVRGNVQVDGLALGPRDYHVVPAGFDTPTLASAGGARVFLRESALPAAAGDAPATVRDAEAGWPAYAPGIERRVLWQRHGQAALLYRARPGAQVPRHTHGHDEECLMVDGELFLDDTLLQAGDYQLAPAGTGHAITETDTGVVIYAHGDLDLRFVG
jgi:quercetin dioxygenase-like cupin family protein